MFVFNVPLPGLFAFPNHPLQAEMLESLRSSVDNVSYKAVSNKTLPNMFNISKAQGKPAREKIVWGLRTRRY